MTDTNEIDKSIQRRAASRVHYAAAEAMRAFIDASPSTNVVFRTEDLFWSSDGGQDVGLHTLLERMCRVIERTALPVWTNREREQFVAQVEKMMMQANKASIAELLEEKRS